MQPLIFMAVFIAIFYFMLIRPQQKRQKATQAMLTSMQVGDSVVTIGGLHGTILKIEDITVIVKSPDGSKLTFDRYAVKEVKSKNTVVETKVEAVETVVEEPATDSKE